MKLSVIIPVYNAEKYLSKCLNSILDQGLADSYEVILINDGSTDGSLQIAESFNSKITNYTIITQANRGEAFSRNSALALSKGEFITFLDSDDYYDKNCLSVALNIISCQDLDILYLRLKQVDEQGNFLGFVYDLENDEKVYPGLDYDRRPFPATIYKREIIKDITFPLGILVGPDSVFNAMVQSQGKRVTFTKRAIYNYTYRTNSLSKQGNTETAFRGFLRAIEEIRHFQCQNFKDNAEGKSYFEKVYQIFVTRIIELNVMPEWNQQRYNELRRLLRQEDLHYILTAFRCKYPYVDSSFIRFKTFQKFLAFKSKIYKIVYRA